MHHRLYRLRNRGLLYKRLSRKLGSKSGLFDTEHIKDHGKGKGFSLNKWLEPVSLFRNYFLTEPVVSVFALHRGIFSSA